MKNNQAGISSVAAALLTAVIVGGGAGAYAWYQQQNLMRVRADLAEARVQMETANASANAARTQLIAIRKELDEQKMDVAQLQAERDSAKTLLEAEKQHSERIRAELTIAREQLARGRPASPQARTVQPQVMPALPDSGRPQMFGARPPASAAGRSQ